ncbi:hypothetical protein ACSBR1_040661 [Camellia fascicularis]
MTTKKKTLLQTSSGGHYLSSEQGIKDNITAFTSSQGDTINHSKNRSLSAWWSLLEIVSPTAEDHILECALLSRRINNDGQLVLLTNGSTLKIKAMEEGLVCETAQEFRDSLVNPFSERFLWAALREEGLGLVQMMLF